MRVIIDVVITDDVLEAETSQQEGGHGLQTANFGQSIGKKFHPDGSVRKYPGNTVVCMIPPNTYVYEQLIRLWDDFRLSGLSDHYIALPPASYHMTLFSGVNDQVRSQEYWSRHLPLDATIGETDRFFQRQFQDVPVHVVSGIEIMFDQVHLDDQDFRILLKPRHPEDDSTLASIRDQLSKRFGVHQPNHRQYRLHITLAYLWRKQDREQMKRVDEWIANTNRELQHNPVWFHLQTPELVLYDHMFDFPAKERR